MGKLLRFSFDDGTDRDALEADIALAVFAAECVYGRPRVRMEVSYLVAEDGATCVLEAGGESGEMAARVFAGLVAARVGEEGFTVTPVMAEIWWARAAGRAYDRPPHSPGGLGLPREGHVADAEQGEGASAGGLAEPAAGRGRDR